MKTELKEKAKKLRQQGMSVKKIAKQLGIANSTASLWTRSITLTDEQKQKLLAREITDEQAIAHSNFFKDQRLSAQQKGRIRMRREKESLYLAGCMLYWGEGGKDVNVCQMTNSELPMLVLFKEFLREYWNVPNDVITVSINAYTDLHGQQEIEQFWLQGLKLPRSCLRAATWNQYPKSSKKVARKLEYGTCTLRVCKTEIVQEIFGAIQEYAGFTNLEWLNGKNKQ